MSDERQNLTALSLNALREAWRIRFRETAPAFRTRDLLLRALVFRLEERRHGATPRALKRRLDELADGYLSDPEFQPAPPKRLEPGSRLTRTWNGADHIIDVVEAGFLFEGEVYPSLTKVAKKITGIHRSGPLFFGLGQDSQDV